MELRLPDIGEGIAEGEILKWLVKEGEKVTEEQPLVEVMTDKVNVQIPSPKSGTISKILSKEGDVVKVGQAIIVINSDGEPSPKSPQEPGRQAAPTGSAGRATPTTTAATAANAAAPASQAAILATPATRKLARELGVDLGALIGSGPNGRITEEDVRRRAREPVTPAGTAPSSGGKEGEEEEERVPVRGLRKLIAERMSKSIHTTAQVTHVDEADMTRLVALREELKESAEKRGVKLTYLALVVKAAIPALREFPYVNASLDEKANEIILRRRYNIGIATDTENGLVVPVVKDADRKDVFEVAGEIQRLAAKARAGQLTLEEVHGSTFTVTNQGSVGGLFATPIINYPEAAILGTHRILKRPLVRDGKLEIGDVMYLSLSFDHRIFDGAYAARFVNRLVEVLGNPEVLRPSSA